MNSQDYKLAVHGAATISENDIATVVIRMGNDGELGIGAYGDARGVDAIYSRICRAYLLTLSQEMLDKVLCELGVKVCDEPEVFKGVLENAKGIEVPIIVEKYGSGRVFCSTGGEPLLCCTLYKRVETRCSCCPLVKGE